MQHRHLLRHFRTNVRDHFLRSAFPIPLETDRDIAGIGLCDLGKPELQPGAPGSVVHFRIAFKIDSTSEIVLFVSASEEPAGMM